MKWGWVLILILTLSLVSGCNARSETGITIEEAWARAAKAISMEGQSGMDTGHMSGSNSAAYLVIHNSSDQADRLLRASCNAAHSTELHISEMVDGVMSMHPVDSVEVPANGKVELKPGGLHIMLIGLNRDLVAGEKLSLTLEFENAGKIQVEAEVRAP